MGKQITKNILMRVVIVLGVLVVMVNLVKHLV